MSFEKFTQLVPINYIVIYLVRNKYSAVFLQCL